MRRALLIAAAVIISGVGLTAQRAKAPAPPQIDRFAGLKARSIGPAGMSGRVAALEGVASDPDTLYAGAATGGVWKSTDGGVTWQFKEQATDASVGLIAETGPIVIKK